MPIFWRLKFFNSWGFDISKHLFPLFNPNNISFANSFFGLFLLFWCEWEIRVRTNFILFVYFLYQLCVNLTIVKIDVQVMSSFFFTHKHEILDSVCTHEHLRYLWIFKIIFSVCYRWQLEEYIIPMIDNLHLFFSLGGGGGGGFFFF
jgi:hypothetical protein